MPCVIFMIVIIYRLYYYCFDIDGASDIYFLWTYGVWVLIPSRFGHFEFSEAASFQFHALACRGGMGHFISLQQFSLRKTKIKHFAVDGWIS